MVESMSLGRRLQRERECHHWTQEQLAKKIEGSVPSINRWEHDRVVPRQEILHRLEEVFGRPLEYWGTVKPILWNIPFLRNPCFTGREQVLQRLHQALAAEQIVALSQARAISGLGGVGKTQTAIEYAYRYADEYKAVLWVRADSHEALISDFAALTAVLGLWEQEETDQFRAITAVKRWLGTYGPWLLIFDNADDLDLVSEFLPRRAPGAVLLTTRSQMTGPYIRKIPLDPMSCEEGVTFLLHRVAVERDIEESQSGQSTAEERRAAQEIWGLVGGVPLALDQAAAYIEETASSLAAYRQLYDERRRELLIRRGGMIPNHPEPITTTWTLSFQKVQERQPAAIELLRLCAYLAPDSIPEDIVKKGAAFLGPLLAPIAEDSFLLGQAIEVLRAYSLIQRDPHGKTLSIHRLVQAVLQDQLSEEERHTWRERAMRAVNAAFPHVEHQAWAQCERLLSQALFVTQFIEQDQMRGEETGRLLYETASYLLDRARYTEAEPLFQRALHIWEQQLGPEHPQVGSLFHQLAILHYQQGEYADAEPLFQKALHIWEQQLGPEHPDVAHLLLGLAFLHYQRGEYTEAEPLFQQALHIWEQQLGPEHPRVASPLNGLAILHYHRGEYAEAEPLYWRVLRIWEQQLGPEHPWVASPLNGLATLYRDRGEYAKAEPLFQRALSIWERQLGPEHPDVAHPLSGLAILHYHRGEYAEAEPLFQRALVIREQRLGPEHPDTATSLNNLAGLYRSQGKYAEAEPLLRRALYIREHQLGPEHSETAETIHDLARLWETQDNREEARVWYARALAVREQALGRHHPKTTETRTRLAGLLHAMGQHEEAIRLEAVQSEL